MKKLLLATVFAAAATTAFAGGMSEPVMEAPVVASTMDQAAGFCRFAVDPTGADCNRGIGDKIVAGIANTIEKGRFFQRPFFD